jgi:hypothetical protein
MPRLCTICAHSERDEINKLLVDGHSALSAIAALFRVSPDALQRHKQEHLPKAITKAAEAAEVVQGDTLLDRLRQINRETAAILREARATDTKDNEIALKAIARVEKQIELEGRLLGELQQPTVNVLIMPEWIGLRSAVVQALEPYPDAQQAVLRALNAGR